MARHARKPPGAPRKKRLRGIRSPTNPAMIAARLRHIEWLNQRRTGKRIIDIAAEAGVQKSTVSEAIKNLMAEIGRPDAADLRDEQNDRLDAALAIATEIATNETDPETRLKALDRIVRIEKRRSEINGSDEPPKAPVDKDGNTVPSFVALPGPLPQSVAEWVQTYGAGAQHGADAE